MKSVTETPEVTEVKKREPKADKAYSKVLGLLAKKETQLKDERTGLDTRIKEIDAELAKVATSIKNTKELAGEAVSE